VVQCEVLEVKMQKYDGDRLFIMLTSWCCMFLLVYVLVCLGNRERIILS